MRIFIIPALALAFYATNADAQSLGAFEPKTESYGLNKVGKSGTKKLFIAGFDVHYQVYNEKQKFKQGGYVMGGGQKGDALAEVSVGLEGLDEKTLQGITDKLYADYMALLKAKGLTVVTIEQAAQTDTYDDYERMQGGTLSNAQIPGVISSTPTGYEYMAKSVNKKGKVKKGGFLGNEQMLYPKLSKELDDAIIGKVNITVLFVKDGQAFQGNGAKLKIKTDLRIVSNDAISMTSEAAIKMKGQNSVTPVSSSVDFYHGKVGMGATTSYQGLLKKDFEINDVIDESKITSYAKGSTDMVGTKTLYATYYSVTDGSSNTTKIIPTDAAKYGKGVYDAASKFLKHHTEKFLGEL